jgi:hypothetical protein
MHFIQSALGHSSVAVTERYYAKFAPDGAAKVLRDIVETGRKASDLAQPLAQQGKEEEVALDERLQAVGVERFTGAPGVTRTRDLLIRSDVVANKSEQFRKNLFPTKSSFSPLFARAYVF